MEKLLNNSSRLNKLIVSNGFRQTTYTVVSPYIAETKIRKTVKKFLADNSMLHEFYKFNDSLIKFSGEKALEVESYLESKGVVPALKKYFKHNKFQKIYEELGI